MNETVYIAGKITGEKDGNIAKFKAAENLLRELGYKTINPHTLCADIHPEAHWTTFMKRCISKITTVDKVVVLDDWYKSKGAQMEVEVAATLGITIVEIETMEPMVVNYKSFATFKGAILNIRI